MSTTEAFDNWFTDLPFDQKQTVLEHIASNYFKKRITEGYYGGPAAIQKGLFAGPSPSAVAACPTCGRPF